MKRTLIFIYGLVSYALFFACFVYSIGFIGIKLEERDLQAMHPEYTQYESKVPALLPSFTRRLGRGAQILAA